MGKAKSGKGGGKSTDAVAAKKCTCDHPYTCTCGNRPPRPSKGHKWDAEMQQWGGKGHKQKGASGQTAAVSTAAATTAVGQTTLQPWQRLPSQLLHDYCQRDKRPRPKFKEVSSSKGALYKYRVIVPDGKDPDKDLFYVPHSGVPNEEQAKEEACLLALLDLTPTLPHERKLPDPYKTTWLHAVEQLKTSKSGGNHQNTDSNTPVVVVPTPTNAEKSFQKQEKAANWDEEAVTITTSGTSTTDRPQHRTGATTPAAQVSTTLISHAHVGPRSKAAQKQEAQAKHQARNARIRHHENVRLANQNHAVYMSAPLRKQIEALLRGEHVNLAVLDNVGEENDEIWTGAESDVQAYVEERLHAEGFSRRQARAAFTEQPSAAAAATASEDQWDSLYEACLQWLLVHVDEANLPAGLDPRGRTLDVVAPPSSSKARAINGPVDDRTRNLQARYALSSADDALWLQKHAPNHADTLTMDAAFWESCCEVAQVRLRSGVLDGHDEDARALALEETEALEAIFAADLKMTRCDTGDTVIELPMEANNGVVQFHVRDGAYPNVYPTSIYVSNIENGKGVAVHVEVARCLSELPLGEPMLFAMHLFINDLLCRQDALETRTIAARKAPTAPKHLPDETITSPAATSTPQKRIIPQRPREKTPFWTVPPESTPPAVAFPKISPMLKRIRKSLPAFAARTDFLVAMEASAGTGQVMLVSGDTGCGKSTQIPQFILEHHPDTAKIVVCQPRRLAATAVASRVADERGESRPGNDSVGYVVRGDAALCKSSRLVFCTTGILLRRLQSEAALSCITHIVVDEVHERSLDSDVLLGLLKQLLPQNKHIRVVLMSATLDAERFARYWGPKTPTIQIPGRAFPVDDFFLEDVLSLTGYMPRKEKGAKKVMSDDDGDDHDADPATQRRRQIAELANRVDETMIEYNLLGRLVASLVGKGSAGSDGSILVFLPGAPEIAKAQDALTKATTGLSVQILPLHGGLQPKEQNAVFRPASGTTTKIVLSTNIAETSVTIPDCTIVIDTAREKQASYDPSNRMPLLVEQFCSQDSCKQRRGRAGRVRQGTCYKLISKATFDRLSKHGEPEIQRCALDQILLSLMFLGVEHGIPGAFLQTLLDPPRASSVKAAVISLQQLGALTCCNDDAQAVSLTPLGMHLAAIPAPPMIGKLMIMGSILGCRQAAIGMAATMSAGRSPFLRIETPQKNHRRHNTDNDNEQKSAEEYKNQNIFEQRHELSKRVGNSDHSMFAAVVQQWTNASNNSARQQLCNTLGLSFPAMQEIAQLAHQLDSALNAAGYPDSSEDANRHATSWRVIQACVVAAMSPAQLVKIIRPAQKYSETAEGAQEKDGQARELKFFIRGGGGNRDGTTPDHQPEERVFIHPSSFHFTTGNFRCPWLVYHSLVRTSKPFLRDVTECNAYALLLFGGPLTVQAAHEQIGIDDWCVLRAHARIGALMQGLRTRLDTLLTRKIGEPALNVADSDEMKLMVKLIVSDGLGV